MAGEGLARALALAAALPAAAPGSAQPLQSRDHPAFATSETCLACHGDVVDAGGHDVSIARDWRATMMAHSARDPYWQAAVRRELADRPHMQAEIEDTCSVCHMPMVRTLARAAGRGGEVLAHLEGSADLLETRAAWDGVSTPL
jgi:hypothetical protein